MKAMSVRKQNSSLFFSSTILVQGLILLHFLNLASVSSSHLPLNQDESQLQLQEGQDQEEHEHEASVSELPDTRLVPTPSVSSNHETFPFPKLKSAVAECTNDEVKIFAQFDSIFDGRIYASDYADDKSCGVNSRNNSLQNVNFSLPLNQCGIQMTTPLDEKLGIEFLRHDLVLYIQYSAFVQQAADEKVAVSCMQTRVKLEENIDQNLEGTEAPQPQRKGRQGRLLKGKSLNSHPVAKKATQIGEAFMEILSGKDPSPKSKKIVPVFVGEDVTLVVSTKVMRGYDARIVNCSVNDGSRSINDGSRVQQILDSAGCSIDRTLVPNFRRRRLPIESQNRLITLHFASFPAFKFPERDHIHMKCSVAYCAGPCPQEICDNGVNHYGSWKDKYGARVADALMDTVEVANSLQVLAPNLDNNGGHQYERHQSSLAFGSATAAAAPSSTQSTLPSNLLDHHRQKQQHQQFSDTTKTYQSLRGSPYAHSAAMSALSSAATGRSMNNNGFYYNEQQQSTPAEGDVAPLMYSGRVTTNQIPPQMMTSHRDHSHPNLSSVCISPGTLILVLVILGVVLVISASATLWLALRRSEAKKYARAVTRAVKNHTTNTLSSYTTSTGSPSPTPMTPYYRFSHW